MTLINATEVSNATFEQFYAMHRKAIGRALSLTLRNPSLGQEAADEAMSRAYQRWDKVSAYSNPQGWVYRAGLNWARSKMRRMRIGIRKSRLVAPADATPDHYADPDVEQALNGLSEAHRSIVVLRFFSDWTIDQIAAALDIPAGTVKSRLSRALAQLETTMNPGKDTP